MYVIPFINTFKRQPNLLNHTFSDILPFKKENSNPLPGCHKHNKQHYFYFVGSRVVLESISPKANLLNGWCQSKLSTITNTT